MSNSLADRLSSIAKELQSVDKTGANTAYLAKELRENLFKAHRGLVEAATYTGALKLNARGKDDTDALWIALEGLGDLRNKLSDVTETIENLLASMGL